MTRNTREALVHALRMLDVELHCTEAVEKIGAVENAQRTVVGAIYGRMFRLLWDKTADAFHAEEDPASPNCIAAVIKTVLQDVKQRRPIVTEQTNAYHSGCVPSDDDLDALADYFAVSSGADVVFQHQCPGLDETISPEIENLVQSRQF